MHFLRGGGGDSPTNAPPLGAVHSCVSAFSQLLLSLGVQLHSLEMRSFLGNLAGRFSFQCNLLHYHTLEKGMTYHFCYSLFNLFHFRRSSQKD